MGNGLVKNQSKQELQPVIVHGCFGPKCAVNETAEKLQYSAELFARTAEERDHVLQEAHKRRRAEHQEKTRMISEHIAQARLQNATMPASLGMPLWHALFVQV